MMSVQSITLDNIGLMHSAGEAYREPLSVEFSNAPLDLGRR